MKPFIVFGGTGAPVGGTADVKGLHGSVDEAVAQIAALGLTWWEIAVWREEGIEVVRRAEAENRRPTADGRKQTAESRRQKTGGAAAFDDGAEE